ncbi:MAG: hypothetical protein ACP5M9_02115 [Candidatus Micrarchaeia archaeon]
MKKFVFILFSVIIFGFVYAGTVTLTGTCTKQLNNNYIIFNLSNSGNDAAYNLNIDPKISYATSNGHFYISSIGPDSSNNLNITLTNVTAKGTYVNYIVVSYQQSSSIFSAIFPCVDNFFNATQSQLLITKNITVNSPNYLINVTVFNSGNTAQEVNVSLIVPEEFKSISSNYYYENIKPLTKKNVYFNISSLVSGGSYTGFILAAYKSNNLTYSSYQTIIINATSKKTMSSFLNINPFYLFFVIIIIIFLVLILRSFIKSRRFRKIKI